MTGTTDSASGETNALTLLAGNTPNTNSNGGVLGYHSATDKTVAISATGSVPGAVGAAVLHLDEAGFGRVVGHALNFIAGVFQQALNVPANLSGATTTRPLTL